MNGTKVQLSQTNLIPLIQHFSTPVYYLAEIDRRDESPIEPSISTQLLFASHQGRTACISVSDNQFSSHVLRSPALPSASAAISDTEFGIHSEYNSCARPCHSPGAERCSRETPLPVRSCWRHDEISNLCDMLQQHIYASSERPHPPAILVLHGSPSVGMSTLASQLSSHWRGMSTSTSLDTAVPGYTCVIDRRTFLPPDSVTIPRPGVSAASETRVWLSESVHAGHQNSASLAWTDDAMRSFLAPELLSCASSEIHASTASPSYVSVIPFDNAHAARSRSRSRSASHFETPPRARIISTDSSSFAPTGFTPPTPLRPLRIPYSDLRRQYLSLFNQGSHDSGVVILDHISTATEAFILAPPLAGCLTIVCCDSESVAQEIAALAYQPETWCPASPSLFARSTIRTPLCFIHNVSAIKHSSCISSSASSFELITHSAIINACQGNASLIHLALMSRSELASVESLDELNCENLFIRLFSVLRPRHQMLLYHFSMLDFRASFGQSTILVLLSALDASFQSILQLDEIDAAISSSECLTDLLRLGWIHVHQWGGGSSTSTPSTILEWLSPSFQGRVEFSLPQSLRHYIVRHILKQAHSTCSDVRFSILQLQLSLQSVQLAILMHTAHAWHLNVNDAFDAEAIRATSCSITRHRNSLRAYDRNRQTISSARHIAMSWSHQWMAAADESVATVTMALPMSSSGISDRTPTETLLCSIGLPIWLLLLRPHPLFRFRVAATERHAMFSAFLHVASKHVAVMPHLSLEAISDFGPSTESQDIRGLVFLHVLRAEAAISVGDALRSIDTPIESVPEDNTAATALYKEAHLIANTLHNASPRDMCTLPLFSSLNVIPFSLIFGCLHMLLDLEQMHCMFSSLQFRDLEIWRACIHR